MLLFFSSSAFAQSDSAFDVNAIAKDVEQRFRACPRREIVSKYKRGLHKTTWQKEAWGPPFDVIADVRSNDSIIYPYVLTVEFNLGVTWGPERKSKAEADRDTELFRSSVVVSLGADTWRNRNVYLLGKGGIRLKGRETFKGHWQERTILADACWDWVGTQ